MSAFLLTYSELLQCDLNRSTGQLIIPIDRGYRARYSVTFEIRNFDVLPSWRERGYCVLNFLSKMKYNRFLFILLLTTILVDFCGHVLSQESNFELPVQLVGFPFIIASVKLTNFLKKFSYSLSPGEWRFLKLFLILVTQRFTRTKTTL